MAKIEILDFKHISSNITFEEVLNWLNVPFKKTEKELKGDSFIVTIEKNLFFSPSNAGVKGSVINFVAYYQAIELREAASLLKSHFLSQEETKPKREIPNLELEYVSYLQQRGITSDIASEFETGFVKQPQRTIMAGRIVVKIHDRNGEHIGYVGFKEKDRSWFFPKGFKRPVYNLHRIKNYDFIIVTSDPFDALRIISLGEQNVVSLLANSMTAEQEHELKRFKNILLFHKEPQNILNRLSADCFIRAPHQVKPLNEVSDQELLETLKPVN